jgi:hypothetical protein
VSKKYWSIPVALDKKNKGRETNWRINVRTYSVLFSHQNIEKLWIDLKEDLGASRHIKRRGEWIVMFDGISAKDGTKDAAN